MAVTLVTYGSWYHGETNDCQWEAKIFPEPSRYGINNGRVSKLRVKRYGENIVCYDRGWDLMPFTKEDQEILNDILEEIEVNQIGMD